MNQQPRKAGFEIAQDETSGASREAAPAAGEGGEITARKRSRKPLVFLLAGLVLAAFAGRFVEDWWTVGRFEEETEDAYVKADIVTLSAEVGGRIISVDFKDNQPVKKGDILLQIDDRDYQAAVRSAEARRAAAVAAIANVEASRALQIRMIEIAEADMQSAQASFDFARTDSTRKNDLSRKGVASDRVVDQAENTLKLAKGALAKAAANLSASREQLKVLATQLAQRQSDLESADVALSVATDNLERTKVRAPRAGVVGNRGVDIGEYVAPGMRLMSVVPLDDIYVVANFKETQIAHFHDAMKARVTFDMFDGETVDGEIESFSPATGSEFAILPPQNATGNFTKIVQRLPVRVRLEALPEGKLAPRPGTSVIVTINTKQTGE